MTPHDDAPAVGRVMRDELRERATKLAQGYLNHPQSVMLRDAIVALFDDLLAQQEAREPDGWAIRMRDGSWRSTIYEDRETAERKAVKAREFFAARGDEDDEFDSIDVLPVYLGAPAPAEGRQVLALDAIRDVLGIDYDEDSAMWYLPAEPAPIECATLGDALRAYAKMAAPASGEPSGAADGVVRRTSVAPVASYGWSGSVLTASCVWTVDEDGNYHTACDGMFIVLEGTPRENGMNYCCYCGRTLTEADGRAPDTQTEAPQP